MKVVARMTHWQLLAGAFECYAAEALAKEDRALEGLKEAFDR
jgi:hypothetical protein